MNKKRSFRKVREGVVISDKMDKTIIVRVDRHATHQKYGRVISVSAKFKVDDRQNQAKEGNKVRIMETRPLSKDKRWRLIEVIK